MDAVHSQNMNLVKCLINNSLVTSDLDRAYYSHGYRMSCSPLTEAVRYNIPLVELLIEARADPNKKHETCALYHGIQLASVEMCKVLFKHRRDPNTGVDSDFEHYKAIHFLVWCNFVLMKMLI